MVKRPDNVKTIFLKIILRNRQQSSIFVCNQTMEQMTVNYIPISKIIDITPGINSFVWINTKEGVYFSKDIFTINSNGITGNFNKYLDKK